MADAVKLVVHLLLPQDVLGASAELLEGRTQHCQGIAGLLREHWLCELMSTDMNGWVNAENLLRRQ